MSKLELKAEFATIFRWKVRDEFYEKDIYWPSKNRTKQNMNLISTILINAILHYKGNIAGFADCPKLFHLSRDTAIHFDIEIC
jgi:hypothetical protein